MLTEQGRVQPEVEVQPQYTASVEFHWGIKVPLRDGVCLNATLYTPKRQNRPTPCVVVLTPYISDHHHERGRYFAAQGLPSAIVDVRGRGNSQGSFRPFIQEAQDGYDVVEWLARQPYCDGKVGMWCGSYLGYAQWATAKELPPHLATMVPTAAPYIGLDFPKRNNIHYPYLMQWLTFTSGRASQVRTFSDGAFWSELFREWHESGRSFHDIDGMFGNPSEIFRDWIAHPDVDEYWDSYNPTAEQYARLEIPILTITGSYDDDQPGALEHYRQHMRNTSQTGRDRHFLVIGPWNHAGTALPKAEFGGVKVGPESLIDMPKLHREWFAWTMQGGARPDFLRKAVAYYVTGAERWRYADTLEAVTARHDAYFLDSTSDANDIFSSGSLQSVPGNGGPDSYTFDPRVTQGPEVHAEAQADGFSLTDQSLNIALRGRQLVYHTEPFQKDVEVSGYFRLSAWIAIDCPDTDFYVSIHEIGLDGSSIRLSTDAIRARYRSSLRKAELITTPDPINYIFDRFTFISRQISRGHRLRLIVAPMGRLIETTFSEKNYNGGGVVAKETVESARAVTVRLFHDDLHRSVLYLPVGQAVALGEPTVPQSSLM